ncbi:hypothetical protein [Clostridium sp.]
MIKLVCEKCAHIWYTSDTSINQKCDECGERLIETDFINVKEIEKTPTIEFSGMRFQ